eukprot:190652-Chlamydomonas_euryale.AAC.4
MPASHCNRAIQTFEYFKRMPASHCNRAHPRRTSALPRTHHARSTPRTCNMTGMKTTTACHARPCTRSNLPPHPPAACTPAARAWGVAAHAGRTEPGEGPAAAAAEQLPRGARP